MITKLVATRSDVFGSGARGSSLLGPSLVGSSVLTVARFVGLGFGRFVGLGRFVRSALALSLALSLSLPLLATPASAIDPGRADGTLTSGDAEVVLTHAYAHLHDNAEGILSRKTELRIVVCDREISTSALFGQVFLPVEEMAQRGEVRGVLLLLDPEVPDEVNATMLWPPSQPGLSPMNVSLSSSGGEGLWKRFHVGDQSVSGEIAHLDEREWISEDLPEFTFTFHFTAPLFHEPEVTADLTGDAARQSPQAEILRQKVAAMKEGDLAALDALSTPRALAARRAQMAAMGMPAEQFIAMLREFAGEAAAMNERIDRLVVRGNRATILFADDEGQAWANFAMVDGVWKSDD